MPVSRRDTAGLAADAVATYSAAEERLLQLIARRLRAGTSSPGWAQDKLAELAILRRRAEQVMAAATVQGKRQVAAATEAAWLAGAQAADVDLVDLRQPIPGDLRGTERRVQQLALAAQSSLDALGQPVTRTLLGAYQDAIVRATGGTLTGAATRLQDAQVALDDLARRGVRGLVDAGGRRWELASYVEMATRSTTTRAAVAGNLDRLSSAGVELVMVSDSPRECELCRPWEGKVLSRDGVKGRVRVESVTTGRLVTVDVAGTVDEAMRDGLMHPNCTHNLSAYLPGATKPMRRTENPKGYEAQQQQRAMERKVREWKRREAVALTPEAQARARAKVRDWQSRLRSHVDDENLPRRREREQIRRAR